MSTERIFQRLASGFAHFKPSSHPQCILGLVITQLFSVSVISGPEVLVMRFSCVALSGARNICGITYSHYINI